MSDRAGKEWWDGESCATTRLTDDRIELMASCSKWESGVFMATPDQAREIAAHLLELADLAEGRDASDGPCEHKSRGYVNDGGGHRDPYCYDCGEWL